MNKKLLFLIEIAIFVALALLLDTIPFLKFKIWPQGGSVSFSMIPIFIMAFRWRLKGGLLAGFLYGVMHIPLGKAYIVVPLQAFIEYFLAYTVLGFAGLFAFQVWNSFKNNHSIQAFRYILTGVLLAGVLRFTAHWIAGAVFFESADLDQNAWIYSLIYNSTYMIPSIIISTIAVYFLFKKAPQLLAIGEEV